jgi:hypothetical protein
MIGGISDWIPVAGWLVRSVTRGERFARSRRGAFPAARSCRPGDGGIRLSAGDVFCSADVAADERLSPNDGFHRQR